MDFCTEFNQEVCKVPTLIAGEEKHIDFCIEDIVAALNIGGIKTTSSCCGHDEEVGYIYLQDGRKLVVKLEDRGE